MPGGDNFRSLLLYLKLSLKFTYFGEVFHKLSRLNNLDELVEGLFQTLVFFN